MPAADTVLRPGDLGHAEETQRVMRFGVFDPVQEVRGLIEVIAREGEDARLMVTWWRGERAMYHRATSTPAAATGTDAIAWGPLSLVPAESGSEWQIRYESADLRAELRWRGTSAPYVWHLGAATGLEHEEQFGTVVGSLEVRGETVPLDALGHREDERGSSLHAIAEQALACRTLLSPDEFTYTAVITVARRDHLFGQLISKGTAVELSTAEIIVAHAYADGPPLLGTIDVEDRSGRALRQSFERGATFTTVETARARFVSRHVTFPELRSAGRAAAGQIDYWHTDGVRVRPHLFVGTSAERAR
jgi:hypothetical protein